MNKERILELAAVIEAQPYDPENKGRGFNMSLYMHSCGTPSCIAGYALALQYGDFSESLRHNVGGNYFFHAYNFLDLDRDIAHKLFEPHEFMPSEDWPKITPQEAAGVLRHLAETGSIDWSPVLERLA